jgi:branched-chain amino acid transport system permease protein
MAIWLPAAGLVPALVGLLIAPVAIRLKGLYLAIVTLGLVFIGEHLFRELTAVTGGPGVGRPAASCGCSGSTWAGAARSSAATRSPARSSST